MNPYSFVPMTKSPDRKSVDLVGHMKFIGLSGRLICQLTTRTPLFVPEYRKGGADRARSRETLKMHRNLQRVPLIPGTSLKGVIRSVAEAAANGCFTLPNRFSYDRQAVVYGLPRSWKTCEESTRLCPTCRLFGMLNRGRVFAGNISVQDALAGEGFQSQQMTLAVLSAPKPRHKPFYTKEPNNAEPPIRGRKFYYHHTNGLVKERHEKDGQNKTVEAILAGAVFTFEVDYANLAEDDFNLLLFSLVLWEDACHKVGMGKPIGLGSAKIEIVSLLQLNMEQRYHQLAGGHSGWLTDRRLVDFVASRIAGYRDGSEENLKELHRILRWDGSAHQRVAYPTREWFSDNPKTQLEGAP